MNIMKKIMLIDTNYAFTSDIESRLILDDIENVEIITRNNINTIHEQIERERPDELLVSASVLDSHPNWNFGIPVKTYAKNSEGVQASFNRGFESYGVIHKAGDLIKAIASGSLVKRSAEYNPQQDVPAHSQPQYQQSQFTPPVQPQQSPMQGDFNAMKKREAIPVQDFVQPAQMQREQYQPGPQPQQKMNPYTNPVQPKSVQQNSFGQTELQEMQSDQPVRQYDYGFGIYSGEGQGTGYAGAGELRPKEHFSFEAQAPYQGEAAPKRGNDVRARMAEARAKEEQEKRKMMQRQAHMNETKMAVERDMGNMKNPAKVVTVFSAKGGVGKTTLTCEIGTYLALTEHGKGKFKVCVADFNIDFGDIMNTLNFDPSKASMTIWAADIRERLLMGEREEDINYTEAQISMYLQQSEATGLYALIAPTTNEDSMDITDVELEIMLRNLTDNGGFDFVICDTGNNTRDSSFIPLERADEVLLVLTQNVNTANCNISFLSTMEKIGFDTSKIKLVINKVQPSKSVGISAEEVEEAFRPFQVAATLKDSNDVKHSNNIGKPLVFNSGHEFTKGIGIIASQLIGENFVLEQPKKKGFFQRLFRK